MKLKWHYLIWTSSHCRCIPLFRFHLIRSFFWVWYFDCDWTTRFQVYKNSICHSVWLELFGVGLNSHESGFEFLVVGQGEAVHYPVTIRKYNSSKNRGKAKKSWLLWHPKDPNSGYSELVNIGNFKKVVRATEMRAPHKSIRLLNDASITWFFTVHNVCQVFALSHSFRHLLNQIEAQRTSPNQQWW